MYAFNKLQSIYATRNHRLQTSGDQVFSWKGIHVYYEKKGSGSPVVLLHALHPAGSAFEWKRIADQLAENHTVYIPDLPGCGRSDKPHAFFTNFYFVQLINDFIKAMSIEHCTLIGSNLSAGVCIMCLSYNPELADRIILVNPPSVSKLAEAPDFISKIKHRALSMPLVGKFIYNILASRPQIDLYFSERYFYNPFHDTEEIIDTYFESALLGDGNGCYFAACLLGNYMNIDIRHALEGLKVPLKLIEGGATEGGEKTIEEWSALKPDIVVTTIPHTRQLPMLEEPEKTLFEITSFID